MKLASKLIGPGLIPESAEADAVHVAAAAVAGCRYLLTWNFRHIANAVIRHCLERVLAENGYGDITICTAYELSETVGG
jgi:hypothetical protein